MYSNTLENTGIFCCFTHLTGERIFFPCRGKPFSSNPAYVRNTICFHSSQKNERKAEMTKVRSVVAWPREEPWDLATAWAFTSGGQTRTGWLHTSAHRAPAAAWRLAVAYPPPHCWFSLGGFSCVLLTWHQLLGLPIRSPFRETGNWT